MEEILVSVIVPVYNSEKTIKRCIESILNQKYGNIELILINDGSTDNSSKYCSEYLHDKRVFLFHQENSGVSVARNVGLEHASGNYITFIDADDFINYDYIMSMIDFMTSGVDIICSIPHVFIQDINQFSDKVVYKPDVVCCEFNNDYWKYMIHERCSVISNAYKSDILKGIRFDKELYVGEDMLFHFTAIKKSKKIVYSYSYHYNYIVNSESAFHGKFNLKKLTELQSYGKILDEYTGYPLIYRELKRRYIIVLLRLLRNAVASGWNETKEYVYLTTEFRKNWIDIIVSNIPAKDKVVGFVNCIFPKAYIKYLAWKQNK